MAFSKQIYESWVREAFVPGNKVLLVEVVPFLAVLGSSLGGGEV